MADLIPVDHITQSRDRSIFEFEDKPIIQAILKAMASGVQDVEDLIKQFHNLNIENSSGVILDEIYGELFNVKRIGRNDNQYRAAILAKISTFGADGTFEKLQDNFERITSSPLVTIYEHYPADVHIHLGGAHSAYTILDAKALTLAGVSARLIVDDGFNSFVMAETFEMDADLQVNQSGVATDLQVKVNGVDTDLQLKGSGTLADTATKARLAEIDVNGVLISDFNPMAELIWGEHQIPDPLVIKLGIVQAVAEDMTLRASGFTGISGTLSRVFPSGTTSSSGEVIVRGSVLASLDNNTSRNLALSNIEGNLNVILEDVTSDGFASEGINGSLSLTMEGVSIEVSGAGFIFGNASSQLSPTELSGEGGQEISGVASSASNNLFMVSSGGLTIDGGLGVVLENVVMSTISNSTITGSLDVTLESISMPGEVISSLITMQTSGPIIYDSPNLETSRVIPSQYDVASVTPSGQGVVVADTSANQVTLLNSETLATEVQQHAGTLTPSTNGIIFNRSGSEFILTRAASDFKVFDGVTLELLETMDTGSNFSVSEAEWDNSGSLIAVSQDSPGETEHVRAYRRSDFSEVPINFPTEDLLYQNSLTSSLSVDPLGRYLCVCVSGSNGNSPSTIIILNTTSEPYVKTTGLLDSMYRDGKVTARFSPSGQHFAIAHGNSNVSPLGTVEMYETSPFIRLPDVNMGSFVDLYSPTTLDWSSDGNYLSMGAYNWTKGIRELHTLRFSGSTTTRVSSTTLAESVKSSTWFNSGPKGHVGLPVITGSLNVTLESVIVPPEVTSALVINPVGYVVSPSLYVGPNLVSSSVIDPIYHAVWVDSANKELLLLSRSLPRIPGKSPISDPSTVTPGPEIIYSTSEDRIIFNRQGTEFFHGSRTTTHSRIYDSKTLAQLEGDFLPPFNFKISDAAWSADGSLLAFTGYNTPGPELLIIRRVGFSEVPVTLPAVLEDYPDPHNLQFDPQGRYLCATTTDGASTQSHILLLDTTSEPYTPILNFIDADYGVSRTDAKFSPDGNYLAIVSQFIGSAAHILNMYDTRTMPFTRLPPPDIDSLGGYLIEWSSDGTHLVTLVPSVHAEVFAFDGVNTTKVPFSHEPAPVNASWFKESPNGTVGT